MNSADRLIVALDVGDLRKALTLAKRLQGLIRYVKIGSALFTSEGPRAIQRLRQLGVEVFLDLKFHDIPSMVEKSCRAAVRHGVWMLTVHASGQRHMLEAAVSGSRQEARRLGVSPPRVVGVTVLTSVEAKDRQTMTRQVVALAAQAKRAGLDGVVASAQEASAIRRRVGTRLLIVCPGIRFGGASSGDQRRVASPREAVARGADFLVVGRPIAEARDPRAVVQQMLAELEG